MYDVVGMVVEDLIVEGMCPACLANAIDRAYSNANASRDVHVTDDQAVRRQTKSDVLPLETLRRRAARPWSLGALPGAQCDSMSGHPHSR